MTTKQLKKHLNFDEKYLLKETSSFIALNTENVIKIQ